MQNRLSKPQGIQIYNQPVGICFWRFTALHAEPTAPNFVGAFSIRESSIQLISYLPHGGDLGYPACFGGHFSFNIILIVTLVILRLRGIEALLTKNE
jgi:hypothetical protein